MVDWCNNTGDKELADINEFAGRTKVHQKYKEGDFFRFRINRFLYGYGRILVDFVKMRKEKISFWDVFMGPPLCVAVYHIATENKNMTPSDLVGKMTLPSHMVMDNIFYYGECEIIGNMPITENEIEYPIHYGRSMNWTSPNRVCYQCGKVFITIENEEPLYSYNFRNNGIGFYLHVELDFLKECIKENSNSPFWSMAPLGYVSDDLRNPKYENELRQIKKHMGIE